MIDLRETAVDHTTIVAHRGLSSSNFPCNTVTAYEIVLMHGADVLIFKRQADGTQGMKSMAERTAILFHFALDKT